MIDIGWRKKYRDGEIVTDGETDRQKEVGKMGERKIYLKNLALRHIFKKKEKVKESKKRRERGR